MREVALFMARCYLNPSFTTVRETCVRVVGTFACDAVSSRFLSITVKPDHRPTICLEIHRSVPDRVGNLIEAFPLQKGRTLPFSRFDHPAFVFNENAQFIPESLLFDVLKDESGHLEENEQKKGVETNPWSPA